MECREKKNRRKFLKTMWGGAVVFAGGMLGFPFGACAPDGSKPTAKDVLELDLDTLPEMTPEEIRDFQRDADQATRDYLAQEKDQGRQDDAIPGDSHEPDVGGDDAASRRPRVPPGQNVLETLIVFGRNPNPRSIADWRLYVRCEVAEEVDIGWGDFMALPRVTRTVDVHCVTGWSVLDVPFEGVLVSDLLALARPSSNARFVVFDCEQGYTTNAPLAEAMKDNVLVASAMFGEALSPQHGAPARGVVPDLYFYKSGKWIKGLRVLSEDEPGYWETRGYSNTADPWKEERYS